MSANLKKIHVRRGVLGAFILAFAVGSGSAQCLDYRFYHEQDGLRTESHTGPPAKPATDPELTGGIALARLIASSGTAAERQAPSLSLPSLDGTEVSLEALRGKIVLLNFWATWCGPCRTEMPSLERLYRDFSAYRDFALLTVNTEQRGTRSVENFIAKNGYDFPVLLDTEDAASIAYGVRALPSTFVIGRDGRIIWNSTGALDWSDSRLRDALKNLLEKKSPRSMRALRAGSDLIEG